MDLLILWFYLSVIKVYAVIIILSLSSQFGGNVLVLTIHLALLKEFRVKTKGSDTTTPLWSGLTVREVTQPHLRGGFRVGRLKAAAEKPTSKLTLAVSNNY